MRKKNFLAGAAVYAELACSPHVCVGFLWVLTFAPTSSDVCEMNWHVYIVPVRVCVCVCVCAGSFDGGVSCPGLVSILCLSFQDRLWPP